MKPFNLALALAGDKIVTREGESVKFIAYVPEADEYCRVVSLRSGNINICSEKGGFDGGYISAADLFMAPKTRTVWVNLYEHGTWCHHRTQESADKLNTIGPIRLGNKAHKIEVEE